jgi:hypothetical protein
VLTVKKKTIGEVEVAVSCKMTVDEETALRCLRLLEIWQDANHDKMIEASKNEDGSTRFSIKELGGD